MSDGLVQNLRLNAEMLQDGWQSNLTKLWHSTVVKDAATDSLVAADEITKLRKALEFYADVSKYPAPLTGGMGALWADCGDVAREALGHE